MSIALLRAKHRVRGAEFCVSLVQGRCERCARRSDFRDDPRKSSRAPNLEWLLTARSSRVSRPLSTPANADRKLAVSRPDCVLLLMVIVLPAMDRGVRTAELAAANLLVTGAQGSRTTPRALGGRGRQSGSNAKLTPDLELMRRTGHHRPIFSRVREQISR
jgi:hypothetical protein